MDKVSLIRLDEWLSDKLADIAEKLPSLVHSDPSSFACGYNSGYKQAMLELNRYLDNYRETNDI